jgi:hypothetical protein
MSIGFADTDAAAGDDRYFVFQSHGVPPLILTKILHAKAVGRARQKYQEFKLRVYAPLPETISFLQIFRR